MAIKHNQIWKSRNYSTTLIFSKSIWINFKKSLNANLNFDIAIKCKFFKIAIQSVQHLQ